ncbi:hypothetical protein E6C60_0553 [Paenibacillus algicola]|uniref:Uncharacterized protein n=1 Tax=Paenibacillus algicola TaxID=2565926 RepID=A0A4P8XFU4_9BACL|nr:hypothetical protein E6C60_0553 [Paenibacillus algicola]
MSMTGFLEASYWIRFDPSEPCCLYVKIRIMQNAQLYYFILVIIHIFKYLLTFIIP